MTKPLTRHEAQKLGLTGGGKAAHRSKYNIDNSASGKAKRTFMGRTYDSIAECEYARALWGRMEFGDIRDVIPQPCVQLGEDTVYRPDFFVVGGLIAGSRDCYYVDVKGKETANFRRNKKLWRKYGRLPLHIVKKKGGSFEIVEVVNGP